MKKMPPPKKMSPEEREQRALADHKAICGETNLTTNKITNQEMADILSQEKVTQFGGTITIESGAVGLYNNSAPLFAGARARYKELGIFLVVADGHVIAGRDGIVARFVDDAAAIACLTEAGYHREEGLQNIIFKP